MIGRSVTGLFSQAMVLLAAMSIGVLQVSAQDAVPPKDTPANVSQPLPAPAKAAATETPVKPITVLEETLMRVRTTEPLNSKQAKGGMQLRFIVSQDIVVGDALAIPRGATVHGVVVKSKKSGVLTGSPKLTLQLVSLDLGGRRYQLDSYPFKVEGTSKTGPTETKVIRGASVGAVVGSAISGVSSKGVVQTNGSGRVASMATGAALGAGVGTAVSALTPGPGIWIPSEAQVDFYLAAPVTVTPVSAKEAAKLSEGLRSGGPSLYLRGDTP